MRTVLLLFFLILFFPGKAQDYRPGDFLFLDLDCGPLCDAIEAVTQGYEGQSFSHVGMVVLKNDSVYILEAIGKAVVLTPVARFLTYSSKPAWHFRLKDSLQHLIQPSLAFAQQKIGLPYDDAFLPNNGKYYCSELIYDAFQAAGPAQNPFRLEPMEYRKPGTTEIFPVWKAYFEKRGMAVPQGLPGCNPGGLSRSTALFLVGKK